MFEFLFRKTQEEKPVVIGRRTELIHDITVFQSGTIFLNGCRYNVRTKNNKELCAGCVVEVLDEYDAYLLVQEYESQLIGKTFTITELKNSITGYIQHENEKIEVRDYKDRKLTVESIVEVLEDHGDYLIVKQTFSDFIDKGSEALLKNHPDLVRSLK